MENNIGTADRRTGIVVGLGLAIIGLATLGGLTGLGTGIGAVITLLGLVLLGTGIGRVCLRYRLLGIDTSDSHYESFVGLSIDMTRSGGIKPGSLSPSTDSMGREFTAVRS
jgi:hypothetical protein